MKSATPPPLPIRKLRAAMEMKWLSLNEVAATAEVSTPRASEILNGVRNDPASLAKIQKAIKEAPKPKEAA